MVQGRTLNEWNLVHVIRQDTTRAALPINPAACYVSHFRWRKLMMLVTTATVVSSVRHHISCSYSSSRPVEVAALVVAIVTKMALARIRVTVHASKSKS